MRVPSLQEEKGSRQQWVPAGNQSPVSPKQLLWGRGGMCVKLTQPLCCPRWGPLPELQKYSWVGGWAENVHLAPLWDLLLSAPFQEGWSEKHSGVYVCHLRSTKPIPTQPRSHHPGCKWSNRVILFL